MERVTMGKWIEKTRTTFGLNRTVLALVFFEFPFIIMGALAIGAALMTGLCVPGKGKAGKG